MKKYLNTRIYTLAVKLNGYEISLIPEKLLTEDMVYYAVKNQPIFTLENIPNTFLNKKIYIEAIKTNMDSIKYIYDKDNDKEFIKNLARTLPLL